MNNLTRIGRKKKHICKHCGEPAYSGEYCTKKECRQVYYHNWWVNNYRKKHPLQEHGNCISCGAKLRYDGEFCGKPKCRRKYRNKYFRNRYKTDSKFRKSYIRNVVKSQNRRKSKRTRLVMELMESILTLEEQQKKWTMLTGRDDYLVRRLEYLKNGYCEWGGGRVLGKKIVVPNSEGVGA